MRRHTRTVTVGTVAIGGSAPISVQSMTNTPTVDVDRTVSQVKRLQATGADIVRIAIPDEASVSALAMVARAVSIPLVADIHFDWRLAVGAMSAGAAKIRINPGTIGGHGPFVTVAREAAERGVPVRVGINAGSLPTRYRTDDRTTGVVDAASEALEWCDEAGLDAVVLSAKSSDAHETVDIYRALRDVTDAPFHLGVTEAGTLVRGVVKSTVAIGTLLQEGIGDTVRISLTADPVHEVEAGLALLRVLGLRTGPDVIACPTCARAEVDVEGLARMVEERLRGRVDPITVAVMGCPVNGPEEARHADIGIAGSRKGILVFRRGEIVATVDEADAADALNEELDRIVRQEGEQ